MPLWSSFVEDGLLPLPEVDDDPLRYHARALKYSNDVVKPIKKNADTGIPMAYATRNKPTDGAVTSS